MNLNGFEGVSTFSGEGWHFELGLGDKAGIVDGARLTQAAFGRRPGTAGDARAGSDAATAKHFNRKQIFIKFKKIIIEDTMFALKYGVENIDGFPNFCKNLMGHFRCIVKRYENAIFSRKSLSSFVSEI